MNYGLSDYEKFKLIRPLLGNHILDAEDMPVMHKVTEEQIDFESAIPINAKNLCSKYDNSMKLVLPITYDNDIKKYWEDPMKYIPVLQTAYAVATPDYSAYSTMNPNTIRNNVYMNRWIGCLWQFFGIMAIPTITWADSDTYHICFSGIERGSVVVISTVGAKTHSREFLAGFNYMMEKIHPSIVIVYGDMIPGMYGRFVNYKYKDAFNSNRKIYEQLSMFEVSKIFEIKRGEN